MRPMVPNLDSNERLPRINDPWHMDRPTRHRGKCFAGVSDHVRFRRFRPVRFMVRKSDESAD